MELRGGVAGPGVLGRCLQFADPDGAKGNGAGGEAWEWKIWGVGREEVFEREPQEGSCGAQAPGMFWVAGVEEMFLEVDKCAGELNEAFERQAATVFQPEDFEDVVGLVVGLTIEKVEVEVEMGGAGLQPKVRSLWWQQGLEALGFFHRSRGVRNL